MSGTEPQDPAVGAAAVPEAPAVPGPEPAAAPEDGGGIRVELIAEEEPEDQADRAWSMLLDHPVLIRELPGGDLWMVAFDIVDKTPSDAPRFLAAIVDAKTGRGATVTGVLDDRDSVVVRHRGSQHPPRDDEPGFADEAVRNDPDLGPPIAAGEVQLYRPVPPLVNIEHPDGSVQRVVTVGLRSSGAEVVHRIVGVLSGNGEVVQEPAGVPAPSATDCGAPPGPSAPPVEGATQARLRVHRGEEVLWDLVVVRPSASSGTNGSGLELRDVDHMGQRLLARAHVPIVTVDYDGGVADGCEAALRSWLNDEAPFEADGTEEVPGFRLCATAPRTVLHTGVDGGGFRGVAVHVDGDEVVLVSQVQAGWYRYVVEWRLSADGRVRPRLGFSAASNPSTCRPHTHHAYWRFDVDMVTSDANLVQEFNDPPIVGVASWQTARFEVRRPRDPAHRRSWRVRDTRTGLGYSLRPGEHDGLAGGAIAGAGDLWLLRYHADELDDGQGVTTDPRLAPAQLDRFVTGEPVHDVDVVLWYGVHVRHDDAAGEAAATLVGPDLEPFNWRAARPREPYPDLVP